MRPALQSLIRKAFRQPASQRFASSSTEAAEKKAQDALSSVQKTAGKVIDSAKKILGPVGTKAGELLGGYKQPLLYNLSVTKEVFKQIYLKEGLQPPSLSAVREAYTSLWTQLSHPGLVRNLTTNGDLGRVGVYGLQAYGVFKIGEILGRRNVVGYKLD